jgi:hypothetical protein
MSISKAELSLRKTRLARKPNQVFISLEAESVRGHTKLHGNYDLDKTTYEKLQDLMRQMVHVGTDTR